MHSSTSTTRSRERTTTASSQNSAGFKKQKLGRVSYSEKEQPFPHKLYRMLESVDSLGLAHTVSWLPDGRSFLVNDPSKFMDLVVPQFFNSTKFRSFQRQLNLWGFHRVAKGRDNGSWYHESFIRGRPEKLSSIFRTKVKGNGHVATHKKQAPNFHLMPSLSAFNVDEEGEVFQGSDCGSFVSADTLQTSNATSDEVAYSDDAFDEKVKALFSIPTNDVLCDVSRLTMDEGCTINVNQFMSFQPRLSYDVSESNIAEPATVCKDVNFDYSGTWDTSFIEPLPMSSIDVPLESDTHKPNLDDFQKFLSRLIK